MWQVNANIIEYLPDWFRQIADFQAICQTETEQFEALATAIHAVADNFFFQTMDEGTVQQWEQIFNIVANPQTETLDFRRARVLNRLSMQPPFTLGFLYRKLDEIIGEGQWTVTVDYPNYTLYIESSSENQQYFTEVLYTINKIKPAHIVYINKPATTAKMTLNESVALTQLTWNYQLGAWHLGIKPFLTATTEEVVVMPEQETLQPTFLNSTAASVINIVSSARVNGSIIINDLVKSTDANTAVIQYTVTEAQTAAATQLELLDAKCNVLTSSPVYVPISEKAIFTHYIPVEEAV